MRRHNARFREVDIQKGLRLALPPFVAHALELDVSSCAGTKDKADKNLKEAVRLFLEEAGKMGTIDQILQKAGYRRTKQKMSPPQSISVQRMILPLPLTHAKT